jgi:ribosome-binding protein aMBF1 (putative translation factor)
MECKICGKSYEEVELFRGIFKEKIESVCSNCSRIEGIPIVKKPNLENFEKGHENLSVRERMERMNEHRKPIPREQFIAHKNLAKLHFPNKREDHPDLIENYDWALKTSRRRMKLSQSQLAQELIIPLQVILDLESGKIAKDFIKYISKLEEFLGIKVTKKIDGNSKFQKKPENLEEERMFLKSVKNNMNKLRQETITNHDLERENKENLKKWTLKDIISLRRRKEKNNVLKIETSEIVGDDIQINE